MTADPDGSSTLKARHGTADRPRRTWQMTLPPVPEAAGMARRAIGAMLISWDIGHLEEAATLLVTELVGNAVRHASPGQLPLELRLEISGTWLRIEVLDADPRPPQPRNPSELDESGRGFVLVEAFSDKWGVCTTSNGKAVWAELDISCDQGAGA
jgi:anti-sigma regulatory factor (Ser/Thr protein kinase)